MMNQGLADQLAAELTEQGAGVVACADLQSLSSDGRRGLPRGVVIGVPLNKQVIATVIDGPNRAYSEEYDRANWLLNQLAQTCAYRLTEAGHGAVAIKSTVTKDEIDLETLSTVLPHKTVARLAGVGWIGKCALLVSQRFGSAIRYATVLTDAPLPTATPCDESECGSCEACVAICPAGAPSGRNWQRGLTRDDFFDAQACCQAARRQSLEAGFDQYICGRCIAACPHTQKYLRSG